MIYYMKIMLIMSILSMYWWRKNIIMLLLSLEFILITLFSIMCSSMITSSFTSILIMLLMMVSGSSLGLSMLVAISKSHNSSNSSFINMLTFDKNIFM